MIKVLTKWLDKIFAEEEAMILLLLIFTALLLIVTMGNVLAPFITSIILAFMLQGLIVQLRKINIPQWLAVSISFLIFVGSFIIIIFIILPMFWHQMIKFANELPAMMIKGQELLLLLPEQYPAIISAEQLDEWITLASADLGKWGKMALSFSISSIPNLMAVLIYLVLVPILVFFFLKDREVLLSWLGSFLPDRRSMLDEVWVEMNQQVANYVRGKAIEILIVGLVTYIAFVAMGLNYAVLLGLLVGFSVLIPYIGAAVVTVPVAMIAFFQWGWGTDFLTVILVYGIIQALDGNVLVPLLFSEAVNLHPVAIILAVLVFGGFWGLWGVFFAIPLATLIKAVINAWPDQKIQAS